MFNCVYDDGLITDTITPRNIFLRNIESSVSTRNENVTTILRYKCCLGRVIVYNNCVNR